MTKTVFITVLLFLLCFRCFSTQAQTEYMTSFDRGTNTINKIKSIPGVNWIDPMNNAYDKVHHRYFFCGSADTKNWRLYTIDAITGKVLSSPAFVKFTDPKDHIVNIQYAEKEDVLYALYWQHSAEAQYLVKLDPATCAYSIVSRLPTIKYIQLDPMMDNENGLYIFSGYDTGMYSRLFSIDVSNGKVVYEPLIPDWHSQLRYDPLLGKAYGTLTDSNFKTHLISIDRITGATDIIATPAERSIVAGASFFTYNQRDHEYIFVTQDSNKDDHLLTINVQTGQEIHNTIFTLARHDSNNLVCFQYDDVLNKLFAIHWEAKSVNMPSNGCNVYPNPFTTETNIVFDRLCKTALVVLYDATGKMIGRVFYEQTKHVVLERNSLAAGVYFVHVSADGVTMPVVKLVAN